MTRPVLILRPEPGASATARRAEAIGLEPICRPLFRVVARDWGPAGPVDAVMITSANAARFGGPGLTPLLRLPLHAVGATTAEAARDAGFGDVRGGVGDVATLIERIARDGARRVLHLAGEDRTPFDPRGLTVVERIVYAAELVEPAPELRPVLALRPVTLLHSARAARRFAELAGDRKGELRIATISATVLDDAGEGWERALASPTPDDDALLAVAARLCD